MRSVALGLMVLAFGCSDTVNVGNSNPTGTVGGIVLDAATGAPLAGAAIKIVSANDQIAATSDMDGVWTAEHVPAGTFILTLGAAGYVTTTFSQTLSGAVGNFPVSNPTLTVGPLGLLKNTGAFNVRLVDENGAAVPGVKIVARTFVRHVDFSSGAPLAVGGYDVPVSTGADGLAMIAGLPNFDELGSEVSSVIAVDVPAVKVTGTESYSFLGGTFEFDLKMLPGTTPTITLAGPNTALTVLDSNISYIRSAVAGPTASQVPPNGPITVAFNQALNPSSVRASFIADDGNPSAIAATVAVQTNLVTITPSTALPPGARFNLQLHAVALQAQANNAQYDVVAPFFVEQSAGVKPTAVSAHVDPNLPPSTLVFKLNEAIGQGSGNSGAIDCVAFYEGVTFDNDNSRAYMGEWVNNGDPASLVCGSSPGPIGGLNVTRVTPVESVGPLTGFTNTWRVQFSAPGNAGCSGAVMSCSPPTTGTKIHLVFSKLPPAATVRRTNGEAMTDSVVVTIQP